MMSCVFWGGVSTLGQIRYGASSLGGGKEGHSFAGINFSVVLCSQKRPKQEIFVKDSWNLCSVNREVCFTFPFYL